VTPAKGDWTNKRKDALCMACSTVHTQGRLEAPLAEALRVANPTD
jgi:hypothetical protein